MKNGMIMFRSITFAQRGQQALSAAGIRALLRRTPRQLEERGCGYGLLVEENRLQQAVDLLVRRSVEYKKVYNGDWEGML